MADGQELSALLMKLADAESQRDLRSLRVYTYEILNLSINGCDITTALPTAVKLLAHTDAFIKRVAGEIITIYAEQSPEMVLLATNTLVQDSQDVNPVVRSIGLRLLSSLQFSSMPEMLSTCVEKGLEDNSAHVRRCAALASIGLNQISPVSVTEGVIWDLLYRHLSDPDSATVASCMCALEEIFAKEKGIVISNKLGQYLVHNWHSYTPTVQRHVLQFLLKHSPRTKAQVFEHLNDLDESLSKSSSVATLLCGLELFLLLSRGLPKVQQKTYSTVWSSIKVNLSLERNEEIVTAVIHYLYTTGFPVEVYVQDSNKFFCRDDDNQFLMTQKIKILSKMITMDNADKILKEFVSSCRYLGVGAVKEMVQSVADVVATKPEVEKFCTDFFVKLIQLGNTDVLECVIQMLPTITFSLEKHWSLLAPCIQDNYQQIRSVTGKVSLLEIIRSHGSSIDNAPEILEEMMDQLEEREEEEKKDELYKYHGQNQNNPKHPPQMSEQFKLSLLGAMVQVCLEKPEKIQKMLSQLMEMYMKDQSRNVRDRTLFLYGYLLGRIKENSIIAA